MRRKELKWKYPAEYGVWNMMKQRCSNPNTSRYKSYGGRGIKVSPRWLGEQGFEHFIEDMGPRPENTQPREWSIDRIDSNKGYGRVFKCKKCGKTIHLECEEFEHVSEHIKKEHQFKLDYNTIIYGLCDKCS